MKVPHSRPSLSVKEEQACLSVLRSGHLAQGPQVEAFEAQLARFCDRRYSVAVSSGTTAIGLALNGLGIGQGDEVILPTLNCAALLHGLQLVGAKPGLVDVSEEDLNICPKQVKKKLTRKTKLVIAAHLFGRGSDMTALQKLDIPVLEDGTQALGAKVDGKAIGSFGVVSIFSFYATKLLAVGEGGVVLTNQKALYRNVLDCRDYDKKNDFKFRLNAKMTDLEAALGSVQLKRFRSFLKNRKKIARYYDANLNSKDALKPIQTKTRDHVYFRHVLRLKKGRQGVLRYLERKGVEAKSPIFKPLHQSLKVSDKTFPVATQAMKEMCSLPIFPDMTEAQMKFVVKQFNEARG